MALPQCLHLKISIRTTARGQSVERTGCACRTRRAHALAHPGRTGRRVKVAVTQRRAPTVPARVRITAMRTATHDKTTRAVRAVEYVTRKLAAKNSRPSAIINTKPSGRTHLLSDPHSRAESAARSLPSSRRGRATKAYQHGSPLSEPNVSQPNFAYAITSSAASAHVKHPVNRSPPQTFTQKTDAVVNLNRAGKLVPRHIACRSLRCAAEVNNYGSRRPHESTSSDIYEGVRCRYISHFFFCSVNMSFGCSSLSSAIFLPRRIARNDGGSAARLISSWRRDNSSRVRLASP